MAMDKSSADSFVYAKASGMLAKSYVGLRARDLFAANSLGELWSLLFKKEIPSVPETLLARELEKEAFLTFVNQYKALIQNYSSPQPVLLALLHGYDYENLKDIGAALALGEKEIPEIQKINPFNLIHYEKWPNIQAMTAESPFSWYNKVPEIREQHLVNYRVDCQNVIELWRAAAKTESSCREAVKKLIAEKLIVDNVVWAIRLRLYYEMERDEIIPLLAYSTEENRRNLDVMDVLVQDAVKSLEWPLDDYDKWKKWKYSKLLNAHEEGTVWNVDPSWISNAFKPAYVEKARKMFHRYPSTSCPMICWFIIKQNELDNIRTASESLRLDVDSVQAMNIAGIMEVSNG